MDHVFLEETLCGINSIRDVIFIVKIHEYETGVQELFCKSIFSRHLPNGVTLNPLSAKN